VLFDTKNHYFINGISINHVCHEILFNSNNHTEQTGCNFGHSTKFIEFIRNNNSSFGINYLHSTNFIEFNTNIHQAGRSANISHVTHVVEFLPQIHETQLTTNINHLKTDLIFERKTHTISTGCSYSTVTNFINFVSYGVQTPRGCEIIHSSEILEYISCGGIFKNCFYEYEGYVAPARINGSYNSQTTTGGYTAPSRIRPRIRRCTT
jgi:hypothetical protein